jgi:hypothetical protein
MASIVIISLQGASYLFVCSQICDIREEIGYEESLPETPFPPRLTFGAEAAAP